MDRLRSGGQLTVENLGGFVGWVANRGTHTRGEDGDVSED